MPAKQISISTSRTEQITVAITLSGILTELNLPHAYIGSFAWALLGSDQQTQISFVVYSSIEHSFYMHDIDMLLQVDDSKDVLALREKLSELNKHFASAASGLKLYYVKVGCFSLAKITLTEMGDRNSKRT